jgi:hypothetical protein
MVCTAVSECGNEIVEAGEECEDNVDCEGTLGPTGRICVGCQCVEGSS